MARANGNGANGGNGSEARAPVDFVNYVVAVDFGEAGDHAFWEAMCLAKRQRAVVLHVIHVVDQRGSIEEREKALSDAATELSSYVSDHGAGIPGPFEPTVVAHVGMGKRARNILQLATDVNADLVIVGASARGRGLKKLLHGSTATDLLRAARVPVLIAYPKDYEMLQPSEEIEPPCPDCVETQRRTGGSQLWCELHSRPRVMPTVWGPTEPNRTHTHDSEATATGVQMIPREGS